MDGWYTGAITRLMAPAIGIAGSLAVAAWIRWRRGVDIVRPLVTLMLAAAMRSTACRRFLARWQYGQFGSTNT